MASKTLVLNDKTQLVTQIMSLAYMANEQAEYQISVDYLPQVDSLTVKIFDLEDQAGDYLYQFSLYLEPSTLEELQKFKDVFEMFLEGKDITGFKERFGYGTLTVWSHDDWLEDGSVATQ